MKGRKSVLNGKNIDELINTEILGDDTHQWSELLSTRTGLYFAYAG